MIVKDFVAVDFETMTAERTSACAIGLVKVEDGYVTTKFYSLIKPIPDERTTNNSAVHGITPEMVQNAPTFADLFPVISGIVGRLPLVCHNRNMDMNVLVGNLCHYDLPLDISFINYCTFELTGMSLEECCKKYSIDMGTHHDALDDATACAKVFLAYSGVIIADSFRGGVKAAMQQSAKKKYDHSTLEKLDESEVVNKDTPFFGSSVVITGVFDAYPNRNDLGIMLKNLGADINTAISKKTKIVVVGRGAGPSKLQKIGDLKEQGYDIRVMFEQELKEILQNS